MLFDILLEPLETGQNARNSIIFDQNAARADFFARAPTFFARAPPFSALPTSQTSLARRVEFARVRVVGYFLQNDFVFTVLPESFQKEIPASAIPRKDVLAEDGGYQREAKQTRVAAVAHRILDPNPGQLIPNTESFVDNINLNIRSNAAEKSYVKPINKSKTDFGDMFTFSYVNTLGKFHTVDGQTRLKGALDAYRTALEGKAFELADEI